MTKARQELLLNWLNSLQIWSEKITATSIRAQLKTGLLLWKIISYHDSSAKFMGLNKRPVAEKACVHNIEQALSNLWKRGPNARSVPNAGEIYTGKRIWPLINVFFEVFPLTDVISNFKSVMTWAQKILELYGRQLLPSTNSPPYSTLTDDFQSGTSLMCIIHCFVIDAIDRPDISQIYWSPESESEIMQNLDETFIIMEEIGFPLFFNTDLWQKGLDKEFLMVQLYYVYFELRDQVPTNRNLRQLIFKDDERLRIREQEKLKKEEEEQIAANFPTYSVPPAGSFSKPSGSEKSSTGELSLPVSPPNTNLSIPVPPVNTNRRPSKALTIVEPSGRNGVTMTRNRGKTINTESPYQQPSSSFGLSFEDPFLEDSFGAQQLSEKMLDQVAMMESATRQQERQLMYVADERRKAEIKMTQQKRQKSTSSYHIHNPKHANSGSAGNMLETTLWFLLTPRILSLCLNDDNEYYQYIFTIVPYELVLDAFFFEWRELMSMEVVGSIEVSQIINVKREGTNSFEIAYPTFPDMKELITYYHLECEDSSESSGYVDGINFLRARLKQGRSISPM